jgi:hypothetical protein
VLLLWSAGAYDHGGETGFWFRDGKGFPGSQGLSSLYIFFFNKILDNVENTTQFIIRI